MKYEVTFTRTIEADSEEEAALKGYEAIFGGSNDVDKVVLTLKDETGNSKEVTVSTQDGDEYAGWIGMPILKG